ncbi:MULTISPECIES: transposase [Thermoleptolyngbya]|uniref:transposase n=1 Tax=Thermoleptolyngbya TaxID=2303528 RepID=UPI001CEC81FF|nr:MULTISPECIES: transposase [Thermoleptolyngbya]
MPATTCLYDQVLSLLRQSSNARDLRHLKALAWMVTALVCSGRLSLPQWEAYVPSRARQAQSTERRWQRFLGNRRVRVKSLYVPLVLAAIHRWQGRRLYLALDTTVLWNRYCRIHLTVTCCGRAVPLLWRVLEHPSATVSTKRYLPMLRLAHRLLQSYPDVMVLADRGFANHDLLEWLSQSRWHYCLRLPSDVVVQGPRRHPVKVGYLWPPKGEARLYEGVGIWSEGRWRCNLVLAHVKGVEEPWAVITDESPSLNTLWQYALRFRVEELFLDSKSGVFELEASGIRSAPALERLYLVAAIAILDGTTQGMAVQLDGLRCQVDPHWRRGISYLNIGLRWLKGAVNKGRTLLQPIALFTVDPEPLLD